MINVVRHWSSAVLAAAALMLPSAAHAVGTAAGTTISNSATATYNINGVPATPVIGSVAIRVDEIIRVAVTAPATQTPVVAGDVNKVLTFRVTNTGNGAEAYNLIANRAVGGDNFDPAAGTAGSLFQDTNGNGVFDAGIDLAVPLVLGVPQLTLNPDVVTTVFVVSNIPAGPTNGQTGIVSLTAQAATAGATAAGVGVAPGTIRPTSVRLQWVAVQWTRWWAQAPAVQRIPVRMMPPMAPTSLPLSRSPLTKWC